MNLTLKAKLKESHSPETKVRGPGVECCDVAIKHGDVDLAIFFRLVTRDDMLRLMVQTVNFSASLYGRNRDVKRALAQLRRDMCENLYSNDFMVAILASTDLFFVALESAPPDLGRANAFPPEHPFHNKVFFGVAFVNVALREESRRGAYIELLCVSTPQALGSRSRGGLQLGKQFLGYIEDVLYARDFRFVFLTPSARVAFSHFYEDMGFRCLHHDRRLKTDFSRETESLGTAHDFKLLLSFERRRKERPGAPLPPWNDRRDLMGAAEDERKAADEVCWDRSATNKSTNEALLVSGWSEKAVRRYAVMRDSRVEAPRRGVV